MCRTTLERWGAFKNPLATYLLFKTTICLLKTVPKEVRILVNRQLHKQQLQITMHPFYKKESWLEQANEFS